MREDGTVAAEVADSGDPISPQAAETFLQVCPDIPERTAISPLSLDEFRLAISHARPSSPGLDGLPY